MANTNTAIQIPSNWVNFNTLSGIAVGDEIIVQSVSNVGDYINIVISDTEPTQDFNGYRILPYNQFLKINAGNSIVWARSYKASTALGTTTAYLQVSNDSVSSFNSSNMPVADGAVHVYQIKETTSTKTLNTDAWYRPKTVLDNSIIHGMFTYDIPVATWKESIDTVEQTTFTNATSNNGKMVLTSTGLNTKVKLDTFRNPRYEPNRGHLYSISAYLPDVANIGTRNFGIYTEESGVMFRLVDGVLYAVVRTLIDAVIVETVAPITLPAGVDLSKGNTFDIQFQWRGVGNYFFFINDMLVHVFDFIGTLTELSMFNPAAPIAFECINQGDEVIIECGCVDVTSEGGQNNGKTYGSISTNNDSGQVSISGLNIPIVVVRNKVSFDSLVNTRDVLSLLATGYGDQRCVIRVWATRDETAIVLGNQVWADYGDGHIERIVYSLDVNGDAQGGTAMSFPDTSKAELIFSSRIDQDQSYSTSALFEGRTDIYQNPGDIFIFTMHRETGQATNVGVTYEFAEAI